MKQQQAPKWLLMTALLAVLGANYSFQSSSLTIAQNEDKGVFELSLVAPAPASPTTRTADGASPTTRTRGGASRTATVSPTTTVRDAASPTTRTFNLKTPEGQVVATGTCQGCSDAVLDLAAIKKIALATGVVSAGAIASPTAAVATGQPLVASAPAALPVATNEYDCDYTEDGKPETSSQKRERLRCEKKEKERIRTEDRTAKFEDKMDAIKDRCEDSRSEAKIECLTREFGNALNRYSGRNALPQSVVQRYFKNVVGSELSKMLFNSEIDMTQAMSALQDAFDMLPSEYSGIRQNILTSIKNETQVQANAINQKYKDADAFAKAKKPAEYLKTMQEAQVAQAGLTQMAQAYSAAAKTSDSFTEDVSFAKYYQSVYTPQMNDILASISPVQATTQDKPATDGTGTRQNTRGSTSTDVTTTTGTRGQATTNTVFKQTDGTPTRWDFGTNAQVGVGVGQPTTAPSQTRGARSMNN